MTKKLAVCIPTKRDGREPSTLPLTLITLGLQVFQDFDIYILDEGDKDAFSDFYFRIVLDMLAKKGIRVEYSRSFERKGVGWARRTLYESTRGEQYVMLLDDDMILAHDYLSLLVDVLDNDQGVGLVSGTKLEADPLRKYHIDLFPMDKRHDAALVPILFGDGACTVYRAAALQEVDWDAATRYPLPSMPGDDVGISLMVADRWLGYGVSAAEGWHIAPARERWPWELPSDALQVEILRGIVSGATLKAAMPYLADHIDPPQSNNGRTVVKKHRTRLVDTPEVRKEESHD